MKSERSRGNGKTRQLATAPRHSPEQAPLRSASACARIVRARPRPTPTSSTPALGRRQSRSSSARSSLQLAQLHRRDTRARLAAVATDWIIRMMSYRPDRVLGDRKVWGRAHQSRSPTPFQRRYRPFRAGFRFAWFRCFRRRSPARSRGSTNRPKARGQSIPPSKNGLFVRTEPVVSSLGSPRD